MGEEYSLLASIYDQIGMSKFAEEMTAKMTNFAQINGWVGRRVMDLGCGTGKSLEWLASHGFWIMGVDNTPEMLEKTRLNLDAKSVEAELVEADILTLESHERIDMVSALGLMNELDSLKALETAFKNVASILPSERFFVFDMHTIGGLTTLGQSGDSLAYEDKSLTVFTRTSYDYERQICTINYRCFKRQTESNWERIQAKRVLRGFPVQAVATLLKRHGFEIVSLVDTRLEPISGHVPRAMFFAKKV